MSLALGLGCLTIFLEEGNSKDWFDSGFIITFAGVPRQPFSPSTPDRLRHARTCYDHMAGTVAVTLHDHLHALGWLQDAGGDYRVTEAGAAGMAALGIDVQQLQRQRRRFACPCLDWSERRIFQQ